MHSCQDFGEKYMVTFLYYINLNGPNFLIIYLLNLNRYVRAFERMKDLVCRTADTDSGLKQL